MPFSSVRDNILKTLYPYNAEYKRARRRLPSGSPLAFQLWSVWPMEMYCREWYIVKVGKLGAELRWSVDDD